MLTIPPLGPFSRDIPSTHNTEKIKPLGVFDGNRSVNSLRSQIATVFTKNNLILATKVVLGAAAASGAVYYIFKRLQNNDPVIPVLPNLDVVKTNSFLPKLESPISQFVNATLGFCPILKEEIAFCLAPKYVPEVILVKNDVEDAIIEKGSKIEAPLVNYPPIYNQPIPVYAAFATRIKFPTVDTQSHLKPPKQNQQRVSKSSYLTALFGLGAISTVFYILVSGLCKSKKVSQNSKKKEQPFNPKPLSSALNTGRKKKDKTTNASESPKPADIPQNGDSEIKGENIKKASVPDIVPVSAKSRKVPVQEETFDHLTNEELIKELMIIAKSGLEGSEKAYDAIIKIAFEENACFLSTVVEVIKEGLKSEQSLNFSLGLLNHLLVRAEETQFLNLFKEMLTLCKKNIFSARTAKNVAEQEKVEKILIDILKRNLDIRDIISQECEDLFLILEDLRNIIEVDEWIKSNKKEESSILLIADH